MSIAALRAWSCTVGKNEGVGRCGYVELYAEYADTFEFECNRHASVGQFMAPDLRTAQVAAIQSCLETKFTRTDMVHMARWKQGNEFLMCLLVIRTRRWVNRNYSIYIDSFCNNDKWDERDRIQYAFLTFSIHD
jgi:hypothetical protein